jgi:glyoxalase family protein
VKLRGIHHITAIASDPQANVDFYTHVLGLRFAKRTVNFDDPSTYHLYYGDKTGRPGTAITFFAWPGARRGTRGVGQVVATSFAIPKNSLEFWKARLEEHHVFSESIRALRSRGNSHRRS